MTYFINRWGCLPVTEKEVPGVVTHTHPAGHDYQTIEISDLHAFLQLYGKAIVSPPGKTPYPDGWSITLPNHHGGFGQR